MAVDLQRIAKAALDAALDQPAAHADVKKPRPRLSGGRAFLVGAGLVAAARLVAGSKAREMLDSLQHRIEESDWYSENGAPEDEAEEDFEDEEPEDEAQEDFEEEDYDEDLEDDDFEGDEEDFAGEAPGGEADEEPDEEEVEEKPPRPRRTHRAKTRGRG